VLRKKWIHLPLVYISRIPCYGKYKALGTEVPSRVLKMRAYAFPFDTCSSWSLAPPAAPLHSTVSRGIGKQPKLYHHQLTLSLVYLINRPLLCHEYFMVFMGFEICLSRKSCLLFRVNTLHMIGHFIRDFHNLDAECATKRVATPLLKAIASSRSTTLTRNPTTI
jgi:hypothetical protein